MALRTGLRQVRGLGKDLIEKKIIANRGDGYPTVRSLRRRTGLKTDELTALANADAFGSMGLDRRQALWDIHALGDMPLPLFGHTEEAMPPGHNAPPPDQPLEPHVVLPAMGLGEQVIADYRHITFTLRGHPLGLLREHLSPSGIVPCADLAKLPAGSRAAVAGLVLVRQRPGTSKGVIFATIEDESGIANIVIWSSLFSQNRRTVMESRLLGARGTVQKEGDVIHLVAEELQDLSDHLRSLYDEAESLPFTGSCDEAAFTAMPEGRNFH